MDKRPMMLFAKLLVLVLGTAAAEKRGTRKERRLARAGRYAGTTASVFAATHLGASAVSAMVRPRATYEHRPFPGLRVAVSAVVHTVIVSAEIKFEFLSSAT